MALMICGTTVSSYPIMPAKIGPGQPSLTARFSRISSLTERVRRRCSEKALSRSSPSVRGRLMKEPPGLAGDLIIRPKERDQSHSAYTQGHVWQRSPVIFLFQFYKKKHKDGPDSYSHGELRHD